jgi:hypothetical protein
MPRAAAAAMRCSMVRTRTPKAPTVVAEFVSTTWSGFAGISVPSAARNRMPVSAPAGETVMSTGSPECRPIPERVTGCLRVCWESMAVAIVGKPDAMEQTLNNQLFNMDIAGRSQDRL